MDKKKEILAAYEKWKAAYKELFKLLEEEGKMTFDDLLEKMKFNGLKKDTNDKEV